MDGVATVLSHAARVYGLGGLSERQRGQAMQLLDADIGGRLVTVKPDENALACAEEAALEMLNHLAVFEAQRGRQITAREAEWASGLVSELCTRVLPRIAEARGGFASDSDGDDYDAGPAAD